MGICNSKINQILLAGLEELRKGQDELRKETRFANGIYYASLTQIWQEEKATFEGAARELRELRAKDTEVLAIYQRADGTNSKEYKCGDFPSDCMFPGKRKKVGNASLARSAPADNVCIFTWNEAIALITGKESKSMFESEDLRNFVCGNTVGASNPFRVWNWNYLQLPIDHYSYYDNLNDQTAVIITPIWDPRQEWKPKMSYKLMIAATPEAYKWLMGTTPLEEDDPQYQWLGEASQEEYEKGTEFLQLIVKALADLLNESELIKEIQRLKELKKEEASGLSNEIFSLNGPVREKITYLYGDFGKYFLGLYNDESASRRTNNSQKSGSLQSNDSKAITAAEYAYVKKILTLFSSKERMVRLGAKETTGRIGTKASPMIYIPEMRTPTPTKPILTIDLGKFFKGKEEMIPDPYWPGMKAGAGIARLYQFPLVSACDSLRDELAKEEEVNDAPLPGEIEISSDCDCGSVSGSSVWSESSECFTGTLDTVSSMLEVGEHRVVLPLQRLDDIASNIVTP